MSRAGWVALAAAALASLAAGFALPAKEGAPLWEGRAFFAALGLGGCVALVLGAKALGKQLLQRPEGYWSEERSEPESGKEGER